MGKIKLILDSMSLVDLMPDRLDADVIRALVNFDGKEYVDGSDISPEQLYELMSAKPNILPKTSQPTIGKTLEAFESAKAEGYSDIICITMSDGLSGTYANTVSAKNEIEGINVYIVNSKTGGLNEYWMAQEAKSMIDAGKPAQAIVDHLESIKSQYKIYMVVGDLTLLHKGGRLSTVKFALGQLTKTKPILNVNTGSIQAAGKARTMNRAVDLLVETVNKEYPKVKQMAILHSQAFELAEELREKVLGLRKDVKDIPIYGLVSTIGSHVGLGTVALTFRV